MEGDVAVADISDGFFGGVRQGRTGRSLTFQVPPSAIVKFAADVPKSSEMTVLMAAVAGVAEIAMGAITPSIEPVSTVRQTFERLALPAAEGTLRWQGPHGANFDGAG